LLLPRGVVARMVVRGQQHFVAGLQVDAGGDEVVRLARVPGDDDFLRRDAQEVCEQLARVLAAVAELGTVVLRRILVHFLRRPVQRVQNGGGRRTEVCGIQHRELLRHHELIADRGPELLVGRRRRRRQIRRTRPCGAGRQKRGRASKSEQPGEVSTVHTTSYAVAGWANARVRRRRRHATPSLNTTAAYMSAENARNAIAVPQSGRRRRQSQLAYP